MPVGIWQVPTLQSTYAVYAYRNKTTGFPSATYADSTTYGLSSSSIASYKAWRNINQGSSSVALQGDEILTRQAKGLGSITSNAVDSIVFPVQTISYTSTPLRVIKFPLTYGAQWIDSAIRTVNFNLTVTAASLTNAPGQQKQKSIYIDSVVGWGTMRVPIVGKTKSTAIPVLQIHHWEISVDSFFLNGSPASAVVLTALGLSQGQRSTVLRTLFYRANATRPLIELVHSTPSHSSTPSTFYIHSVDLLEDPTTVPEVTVSNAFNIYPNPIVDGKIGIEFKDNQKGNWSYIITNNVGQLVQKGSFVLNGVEKTKSLSLPDNLSAGSYFIMLENSAHLSMAKRIIIK
ncbi:MAG: T9SS type A sorting domain-containing protein [Chitinophagaceae bacterium]